MSSLVASALEWLAASGAPNWLVVIFLLTSPWTWADKLRKRVGPLIDQLLPANAPDDETRAKE